MFFIGGALIVICAFYISSYIKLIRKYNNNNFNTIKKTPNIGKIEKVVIKDKKIKEFEKKLLNIKCFNYSFFYHNVRTLKIDRHESLSKYKVFIANYDPIKNVINITDEKSFPHELNHMSSSYYDGDDYSGLSQNSFGTGLNEGYTELLAERYFKSGESYPAEFKIASNLEQIVGREKMEQYYYTANLFELIEELKQYDTHENIMKFIGYVDIVTSLIDNYFKSRMFNAFLKKSMKKINLYLLKWYTIKQKRLMENKNISLEQCYSKIYKYSKRLYNLKNMESTKYKVLTKKIIDKKIKEYL